MEHGPTTPEINKEYAIIYYRVSGIFLAMAFTRFALAGLLGYNNPVILFKKGILNTYFYLAVFCLSALLYWLKYYFCCVRGLRETRVIFLLSRFLGLFLVSFFIVFLDIGQWTFIMVSFIILTTCLTQGLKTNFLLMGYSFLIHVLLLLTVAAIRGSLKTSFPDSQLFREILPLVFPYGLFVLFAIVCRNLKRKNKLSEQDLKLHYEKIRDANVKLEETNKKLTASVAEFYTLQQISQAISSILNIKELLHYVNDIIIGVIGASFSTILLYDEKKDRLKVHTTNITNPVELAVLKDNANIPVLLEVMDRNGSFVEGDVNPERYLFTAGRDIHSLICVPLSKKTRKLGIILIEHRRKNAFDDSNARLLDVIGQQVGIALENAELYQKMQDLAKRDGLTGIYNRLYFHERLEEEFNYAILENYPLSLCIFDIDHFKKFNDAFGHLFGDKVLKAVAELVGSCLRKTDILARFGGEEFVILLPHTSLREAYEKAENIRQSISRTMIADEMVTAYITVSLGVSCYPGCAMNEKELIATADDAMYEAKASGRNCVRIARELGQ